MRNSLPCTHSCDNMAERSASSSSGAIPRAHYDGRSSVKKVSICVLDAHPYLTHACQNDRSKNVGVTALALASGTSVKHLSSGRDSTTWSTDVCSMSGICMTEHSAANHSSQSSGGKRSLIPVRHCGGTWWHGLLHMHSRVHFSHPCIQQQTCLSLVSNLLSFIGFKLVVFHWFQTSCLVLN